MSARNVFAGIDIGGTNIKFGLVDSTGEILYRERRPTMAQKGPVPLMHLVTNIAERLLYHAAEEEYAVNWVGVGSPGAIDFRTGRVVGPCPNIKGWEGMEIGQTLSDRLNTRVLVDNDANAMALAETKFGAALGARSVVCATVGTGIGGGVVIDGKIWRGASSSAGELGHLSIDPNGPECKCGNRGCMEVFCCSQALIERVKEGMKTSMTDVFKSLLDGKIKNLSVKKIFAAAKKNDPVALEAIDETAYYLGYGLAGVVNLLNPEVVVIGGGILEGGGGFLEKVTEEIKNRAFSSAVENLRVVRAALGNDAGFIGAGLLGLNSN